jgi:predicted acetyltransferase
LALCSCLANFSQPFLAVYCGVGKEAMKILYSILLGFAFYLTITFIEATSLRKSFIVITQSNEVSCTVEPTAKSKYCFELNSLTEDLKLINEKLTLSEIVYCNIFKIFSFNDFDRKCSNFKVAHKLYVEIKVLKKAVRIFYKNN